MPSRCPETEVEDVSGSALEILVDLHGNDILSAFSQPAESWTVVLLQPLGQVTADVVAVMFPAGMLSLTASAPLM